jgi:hypothetical protein
LKIFYKTVLTLNKFWRWFTADLIVHHTKICRWYLLVVILKIDIKYTFLLDFIYFHETIDFSLTSVTSSHVQIWNVPILHHAIASKSNHSNTMLPNVMVLASLQKLKIKYGICVYVLLSIILKYAVGTCLWLYWKLTLNTHSC